MAVAQGRKEALEETQAYIDRNERQFTFTIDEEEEIMRQYELEKEKETPRKVSVKMIRVKAQGSRRPPGQADEEAEEATEEEFHDEEPPEDIEDEDENEELLDAL